MLFNSFPFIFVFLPVVIAGTFWLGRRNHGAAILWLAAASLVFYAAWDARFLLLLLGSIACNYAVGRQIHARAGGAGAKACLVAAIVANLALLAYFKYANFFLATLAGLLGVPIAALGVILPLGISFYTFTQIAFLVDVYRGIAGERSFVRYLLFVTYFPHLIAGPLLHHKQVMPQLADLAASRLHHDNLAAGATIFVLGLAKKVLLADPLGGYASPVFEAASEGRVVTLFEAWMGAVGYTLQLYFDFSGYCDMAVGLSLMLNVRMPLNFDSPYKAASIIDFWRRWHMTLSAFLRDYLYIPLGGNRKGPARRYVNLMLTMLLGGLWHGAGWTFVAWGGLHGLYLLLNHEWRRWKARRGWERPGRAASLGAVGLTFLAVVVGWVVFRSDSLATAGGMLAGMSGINGVSLPPFFSNWLSSLATTWPRLVFEGFAPASGTDGREAVPAVFFGLALVWFFPNVRQMFARYRPTWDDLGERRPAPPIEHPWLRPLVWGPQSRYALAGGGLLFLALYHIGVKRASEFLYFQF